MRCAQLSLPCVRRVLGYASAPAGVVVRHQRRFAGSSNDDGESTAPSSSTATAGGEKTVVTTTPQPDAAVAKKRPTTRWSVDAIQDEATKTVNFSMIDEVETEILENLAARDSALTVVESEENWRSKLMFEHLVVKTPKHLTWAELGKEMECLDCIIEVDKHRPEERFAVKFYFINKESGLRDLVWEAKNDVSRSEGLSDLMAAIGSCLSRADVHRTIRFDDGQGEFREISIRKNSRYTSDMKISFRPATKYNLYEHLGETEKWTKDMEDSGMSTWGFHPQLMDPEYREKSEQPEGTYTVNMSAHAFSFVLIRAVERLAERPLKEFYRPSQITQHMRARTEETIGLSHAARGWLGCEERMFPHFTPIDAIQEHWFGSDSPYSIVVLINKLRELGYLAKRNPEWHSWLSVRKADTAIALRNVHVKALGVGPSQLFMPLSHDGTLSQMLPKSQRRIVETKVSMASVLGLPDETRRLDEYKQLTQVDKIEGGEAKKEAVEGATPKRLEDRQPDEPSADSSKK